MTLSFSEKSQKEIGEILKKYPDKEACLLPVLYVAQNEFKYIYNDVIDLISDYIKLPATRVKEVATFYTMYYKKPVGKYHLQFCNNIACSLRNSKKIIDIVKNKLKIEIGETTSDGKFTLSTVECLGACGTAPVMQVNNDYYENLTEESVLKILDSLK